MKKLVLVIVLLVAIPAMLIGCSKSESAVKSETDAFEDTLNGFFSAYNSGHFDKCLTYIFGMTDASEGARDAMKTTVQMTHSANGDIKVIKIENITIGESTGTADLTCKVKGYELTWEVTLDKIGDSWWINWEKLWGPPK